MGCRIEQGPEGHRFLIRNGTRAFFFITVDDDVDSAGNSTGKYVKNLSARTEFTLPRMLAREKLDELAAKQKEFSDVFSFLDGKVAIDASLWVAFESRELLERSLGRFFGRVKDLADALRQFGGKQVEQLYLLGGAPLDLSIRLNRVEEEDMMFILFKLGWRDTFFGGWRSHWDIRAKPLDEDISFSCVSKEQLKRFGFPESGRGFVMTAIRSPRDQTAEEWLASVGSTITWARVTTLNQSIQIRAFFDTSSSPTVGEIVRGIEAFSQNVKGLGLRN
jgi:hypothetical protein